MDNGSGLENRIYDTGRIREGANKGERGKKGICVNFEKRLEEGKKGEIARRCWRR